MRIRGYAPATPCWSELASPDPAAAGAFYSGLFGWGVEVTEVGSHMFTMGGLAVAGMVQTAVPDQPSAWFTYMSTEDIAATTEAVTTAGGVVLRPPTDVSDRGQLALFADSEGAAFAVWQRGTFRGAQLASEPGAVCWSELATRDVAATSAFYGKVFGWTDQPGSVVTGHEYFEWSVNNRVVGGMIPMGEQFPPEVPSHWRTTVEVDDCAAVVDRCRELGGQVLVGPLDVLVGQYAQLLDPLGAALGVIDLIPELRLTP